jgi:hypothetical protein
MESKRTNNNFFSSDLLLMAMIPRPFYGTVGQIGKTLCYIDTLIQNAWQAANKPPQTSHRAKWIHGSPVIELLPQHGGSSR